MNVGKALFTGMAVALLTLFISFSGRPAMAAGTIELRIADSLPSGHIFHTVVTKPFMEGVEKATKGQVKFKHFPGEQLGKAKDMLMLTQSGVTDIGYIGPAYISDKLPLTAVLELPGAFSSYDQGNRVLWDMTHNGGFLEKKEWQPNHVIPVVTFLLPPYQLHVAKDKKISSVKDIKGLKLRSSGGPMDFMQNSLGAVPVRMGAADMYEALSRGTVDGVVLSYDSVVAYSLDSFVKTSTTNQYLGTVALTYSISENKWRQLPENVRKAIMQVGEQVSKAASAKLASAETVSRSKMVKKGLRTIQFDAANQQAIVGLFSGVKQNWAKSLDRRGKPGTEALAALDKALRK